MSNQALIYNGNVFVSPGDNRHTITLLLYDREFLVLSPLIHVFSSRKRTFPNFQILCKEALTSAILHPRPTMKFPTLVAITAILIAEVSAHSRVWSVWIGGSDQGAGAGRYIRQPPVDDPVKNLKSSDIRCNVNGSLPVPTYVSVPAGGTVTTEWCTYAPSPVDQ